MEEELKVGDCMTKGVIAIPASRPVIDAARAMSHAKVGSVIVLKNNKAVGIVTERDIVRKVVARNRDPSKVRLSSIMSSPLRVVKVDTSIGEAARIMRKYEIKKLPVVNNKGMLVGVVTETDILRAYPGLVDVLVELAEVSAPRGKEPVVGVCERCGTYSTDLKLVDGMLLCSECRKELEESEEEV
ncbi:CBS domain-containing protein [Candidatus Micrarchaeota archaeon]|nr:CBS domain-containing protein [Candidatus Micrarchaeota archaeon]